MGNTSGKENGSRRLRRLGIAALVVGGSATGAVVVGGNAMAKAVCTAPLDSTLNSAFQKLPIGVRLTSCDGRLSGKISPNDLINGVAPTVGKTLPPITPISFDVQLPQLPQIPTLP